MEKISKEEIVHSTLVGMARKLGPHGQLPTVKQLCSRLSVSRSTLDRVLRSLEKERLLVCRHGSGIFVSPHSNRSRIGLVFGGDIHDPLRYSQFWWLLHRALLVESERHQNELRTYYSCPTLGSEISDPADFGLHDDLEGRRLSGLVIAALNNVDQIRWLRQWRVPIVSLGEHPECDACIIPDGKAALRSGLRALAQMGCKRVALVATGVRSEDFEKERDSFSIAFKRLAQELRLEYSPDLRWFENTLPPSATWETHEDAGIKVINHHLSKKHAKIPDGLFFLDDTSAHGGLIALLNRGVVPGKSIQVAVQTNKRASLLRPFNHQIFRVEFDPEQIADRMFLILRLLLNAGQVENGRVLIEPALIKPEP